MKNTLLCLLLSILSASISAQALQTAQDKAAGDANTSGCGFILTDAQRFELLQRGFLLVDANNQGFNFFGKNDNVWNQNIYFYANKVKYRAVFMSTPSILKEYVGSIYSCGRVSGFAVNVDGGSKLTIFSLESVSFSEN